MKDDQMKIMELTGASVRSLDNWLARLPLRTEYEETRRGINRRFSRENALELCFVSIFMRAGARSANAVSCASQIMEDIERREAAGAALDFYYIFQPGPDPEIMHIGPTTPLPAILALARGSQGGWIGGVVADLPRAKAVTLIDVAEIVASVDRLFGSNSQSASR
jgi:hypothetical protein